MCCVLNFIVEILLILTYDLGLADQTMNCSPSYMMHSEHHVQKNKRIPPHVSLIDHLISQPSLDISPIWTHVITAEVKKLQLCPV
jgi:hypothetical protein